MEDVTLNIKINIENSVLITKFLKIMERANWEENPYRARGEAKVLKYPKEHEAFEKIKHVLNDF